MSQRVDPERAEEYTYVPTLREPRHSQAVERGLAVLECFNPQRRILGIADIADELGMSRSTTHRYVITLVALDFIEQLANRKYRLGLRVTDLGMSALNLTGLREHAHPSLEELRKRTMFTTSLAVLDGPDVLYVDRARSMRRGQDKIDRCSPRRPTVFARISTVRGWITAQLATVSTLDSHGASVTGS
jgi:IclR family pca regulon transcriptional regulator